MFEFAEEEAVEGFFQVLDPRVELFVVRRRPSVVLSHLFEEAETGEDEEFFDKEVGGVSSGSRDLSGEGVLVDGRFVDEIEEGPERSVDGFEVIRDEETESATRAGFGERVVHRFGRDRNIDFYAPRIVRCGQSFF